MSESDGKRVVEGVVFWPDKVTGIKELAENSQKDFPVDAPEPQLNFDTDIATLQTAPLEAGDAASINFYHSGGRMATALSVQGDGVGVNGGTRTGRSTTRS